MTMVDDITVSQKYCYDSYFSKYRTKNEVDCIKVIRNKKIDNSKFQDKINEFIEVFHDNFPSTLSDRLEENLNTIKVIKKSKLFRKKKDVVGTYSSNTNEIILYEDDSLDHELFHMSSSLITPKPNKLLENYDFIGFRDGFKGKGLNEGYTQLLSERFFDTEKTYIRLVEVVKVLEYIIGKDIMQECYFDTGLKGLIDELIKYFEPEEYNYIDSFIMHTNKLADKIFIREADYSIVQIYGMLFNLYSKKLIKEINENNKDINTELAEYDSLWYKLISKYSNDNYFKIDKSQFKNFDESKKEIDRRIKSARRSIEVQKYYKKEKARI